jgi:hypothetical protein
MLIAFSHLGVAIKTHFELQFRTKSFCPGVSVESRTYRVADRQKDRQ